MRKRNSTEAVAIRSMSRSIVAGSQLRNNIFLPDPLFIELTPRNWMHRCGVLAEPVPLEFLDEGEYYRAAFASAHRQHPIAIGSSSDIPFSLLRSSPTSSFPTNLALFILLRTLFCYLYIHIAHISVSREPYPGHWSCDPVLSELMLRSVHHPKNILGMWYPPTLHISTDGT